MSPLGCRTPKLIGHHSCAPFERTHERKTVIKNEDCHFSLQGKKRERNKSWRKKKKRKKLWSSSRFHWNSLSCLFHTPGSPWSGTFPLSLRDNKLMLLEVTCLTDCSARKGTVSELWMVMSILLTLWGHRITQCWTTHVCVLIVLQADMRMARGLQRDPAKLRALFLPV